MNRIDRIAKKIEDYDAGKVVLMPPHADIIYLLELARALRHVIQWSDACWTGGYAGNQAHPAWEDVQEARKLLKEGK